MTDKDKLEKKIADLEIEHAKGVQRLMGLRQDVAAVEGTIARIEGAITVCRDLIREGIANEPPPEDTGSPQSQSPTNDSAKN